MHDQPTQQARAAVNWYVPLIILLFCAVAYYLTTTFDRVPPILKRGMQPADFPQIVIVLLSVLALWLMLTERAPAPQELPQPVYLSIGLMVAFTVLAEIDLFLGLGVFGFCLTWLWGDRRWWALAIVALIVPLSVFFLFDSVFEIRFPRGLLTNIWYG